MKTLIHEQNCEIGRANRLLLNKADRVCLTFENRLLGKNPKYILTGNPIRQGLLHDFKTLTKDAAMSQLGLSFNKKTILVLGGSAGASFINKLVMDMASGLSESEKEAIQIIHITGKNDFEAVSKHYRNKIITSWVRDFYERVGLLYKAADIIVCRCGATTIAEICLFGIPAILIPYPGAGSHQKENAQILEKKAKAILLDQAIITADELKMWVWGIISNKKKTQDMSQAMRSLSNADAAVKVADTAQELINAE
jgi:UDP-N-acetylglucosamine--N-acetylmuramyl-(pentapeptide) pyrophosphoryl-undecaprenol N-acetylglucosamine transferase